MWQAEITIFTARTGGLGPLKGKIMGSVLSHVVLFVANSKFESAYVSINSSFKILFLFILLHLFIANWQVLLSKYKCTSSDGLSTPQLISAGGGISSLFFKKWFCLWIWWISEQFSPVQRDPKVSILDRVDRTKEIIITSWSLRDAAASFLRTSTDWLLYKTSRPFIMLLRYSTVRSLL